MYMYSTCNTILHRTCTSACTGTDICKYCRCTCSLSLYTCTCTCIYSQSEIAQQLQETYAEWREKLRQLEDKLEVFATKEEVGTV